MTHIEQRYDIAAAWASANPVLNAGEVGWETDTRKSKLGDGVTAWNSLFYTVGALTATKASLGLDQVDNTSDADKPPSDAVQAVLDAHTTSLGNKAPLASPTFTGNPTAPTPTAGDADTSVATTGFVTGALSAVSAPIVQIFRASGTWVKPAGAKYVLVRAVGGGGAGGGTGTTASGEVAFGGAGGAGGYAERRFAASTLSDTGEAVVVGAGGLGVAGAGGNAGTSSTFKTLAANGGSGGGSGASVTVNALTFGGAGGSGTGDLVIAGASGGNARGVGTTNSYFGGGKGGNSILGMGAPDSGSAGNGNNAGANTGGGGSGGLNFTATAAQRSGGNGGSGIVIVATYF